MQYEPGITGYNQNMSISWAELGFCFVRRMSIRQKPTTYEPTKQIKKKPKTFETVSIKTRCGCFSDFHTSSKLQAQSFLLELWIFKFIEEKNLLWTKAFLFVG